MATWEIRPEVPQDAPLIDSLVVRTFGPGRFTKSAWRLREGVSPVQGLSFVAIEGGVVRGSVRFWPIAVGHDRALLLGPLAVESDQRGRGIGIALMKRGIEEAGSRGHRAILLVGDAPYYGRVGFASLAAGKVRLPGPVDPARILGLELVPGALDALTGEIRRPRIDMQVCADSAPLAPVGTT
ncbi:MAG TPA: N-acetyltransferase [Rhizomicrobium sp.]|jgi:predicted N-acetyltransferase YhbS